ncbi:MAG: YfhO family protein [Bacteroidia bacterium]
MKKLNLKSFIPEIVAFIVFISLSYFYFTPAFKGKVIVQSDMVSVQGMAKEINDFREQYNEEALWTNSMFGGMPAYLISIKYKNNLLHYVRTSYMQLLPYPANTLFIYLSCFFILLLVLKIDPWLSIVGAIAYAFSAYFIIIIEAGHYSKSFAIGFLPLVFAGVILVTRRQYMLGSALTALFLGIEINCTHPQITYYLSLFLCIYVALEWIANIKQKEYKHILKSIGMYTIAVVLAVGCNINSLWNTAEYGAATIRGKSELNSDQENKTSGLDKDYATQWSMGKAETMSLMIPGFKGRSSTLAVKENKNALKNVDPTMQETIANTSQYWGDQPFTTAPYAGAIVLFVFVFGLFIVEGRLKWGLLGGTIFSVLMAWGKNFMPLTEFFLNHFPAYNKFRTVSMILIIAEFTIPLLAVIALDKILKTPDYLNQKLKLAFIKNEITVQNAFIISFVLTGGLSLLYYLVPSLTSFFADGEYNEIYNQIAKNNGAEIAQKFMDNLEVARINLFQSDALRSFIFILLGAVTIFLFLKSKINKVVLITIIGILILVDLVQIDRNYLNDKNFKSKQEAKIPFPLTTADKEILQDKDPNYRVLNISVNTFNESGTSYYHKSIGGYHAAKLRRYQDLIDNHIQNNIQNINRTLRSNPTDSSLRATFAKQGVLNMLNTRYIIYNPSAPPIQNRYALGNAWFVKNIQIVKNPDEELKTLGEINPATTAIVDERFKNELAGFNPNPKSTGSIKLLTYKPNNLKYESNTQEEELAVFSEIYYNKGWNAYVDGELKPHIGVNYVLRAMRVPSGKHTIEFKFEPPKYFAGEKISLVSSLLLLGFIGVSLFITFKKKNDTNTVEL